MKKVFASCSLVLAVMLVSTLVMSVFVSAETYGELSYTADENGITIVDCSETASSSVSIPRDINGVKVTAIAERAFADCTLLTEITVPATVKTIGDYAFYRCYGLESVRLSHGVESIGEYAFDSCKSLDGIFIPTSVTGIGDFAFSNCDELATVTVAAGVSAIGENSFRHCAGMSGVYVTDGSYAHTYLEKRLYPVVFIDGDADLDGQLTNADVSTFVRYLSGWDMADNFDILKMDVYTDGALSNRDVIMCIQKLAGWR